MARDRVAVFRSKAGWRIIPSRYPLVGIWDRIASSDEIDDFMAIESITNDVVRQEIGLLSRVRPKDRVAGPGATPIMSAFIHGAAARFNDDTFGALYAGFSEACAIAESKHGRALFLAATNEAPTTVEMRVYGLHVKGTYADVRDRSGRAAIYAPDSYVASERYGRTIYARDAYDGIVYRSVRFEDGECVAVFRPRCVSNVRVLRHLVYVWDGSRIGSVLREA